MAAQTTGTATAAGNAAGPSWAGPAALVASIMLLGTSWPMMKIALHSTGPVWMAAGRLLIAGVLYVVLLAAQGRLIRPPRAEWRTIVLLGVCQGALMTGLVTIGVATVGAGRSAILAYTSPIWVIPIAAAILGERISRWQLAGLALGVSGVLVMFNPADFDWTSPRVIFGNACVLGGAMAMSTAQLAARRHRWSVPPLLTLPYQTLLGGLILVPVAMLTEGVVPRYTLEPGFLLAVAYIGGGATFVAYWTMLEAARRLPAARLSLAQLVTPVWGVSAVALWTGETLSAGNLAGLVLILGGVAVSLIRRAAPQTVK